MITIKDLGFSYGEKAVLKNITMNLEEGRIYGLLGENGVGKTTLLTLLCGLKKPQTGTIGTDGRNPYDREPSLLSEQYYLSDEVPPMNMKAADYAKNYGKFWEGFDMDKFIEVMDDDLNTADGIAAIFELVSEINLDVKDGASKSFAEEALKRIKELTDVLGIFGGDDEEEGLGDDIQALIDERQAARKEKNWARADEIRDQLAAMGITLKDTPQGVQVIRN